MGYHEEGRGALAWTIIVALCVLVFVGIAGGGEYVYQKVWGVKTADVQREVFEESKSYQHGTIRDLENLRVDYAKAETDAERAVLRETVLHRAATFDAADLPPNLREFVDELRTDQEETP